MEQQILAITNAEQDWINEQLVQVKKFVSVQLSDPVENLPSPKLLDKAFAEWLEIEESDIANANDVINWVGVAFGQHLINATGFDWVIATDEYGSELAVYGLPNNGDVLVYPQNFIAKRYQDRQVYFIDGALQSMIADIDQVKGSATSEDKRPRWKFWSKR